ncbi:acetyltransferase, GNAT family [Aneurinibacillus aneurinilyticus ATCC 12856]|jgi:ribosomal protein S18 acetylase RimI-like enzyme|uniref:Acetyltransferase, GNAT family n=2 Tax=Aneurinibacillus aneurinilyticus TaxID=1391 RepID=U1YK90_ANEAE|nr:acetyltransferase, GNAT family [Aneurinibacillus aneurinilyticus ATCC 12856]
MEDLTMEFVTIRPVTKADLPQLLELMHQYIVDFYQSPDPGKEALTKLVTHLIDEPSSGIQFVAETEAHRLAGFATLYFTFNTLEAKRMAFLYDLFVVPSTRGQKIGEKLFQTCLSYIRGNNYSHMIWETAHDNHTAQALYDKMGAQKQVWLNYEIR